MQLNYKIIKLQIYRTVKYRLPVMPTLGVGYLGSFPGSNPSNESVPLVKT